MSSHTKYGYGPFWRFRLRRGARVTVGKFKGTVTGSLKAADTDYVWGYRLSMMDGEGLVVVPWWMLDER